MGGTILGFFVIAVVFMFHLNSGIAAPAECASVTRRYSDLLASLANLQQQSLNAPGAHPPLYSFRCRGHIRFQDRDILEEQQLRAYSFEFLSIEINLLEALKNVGQEIETCRNAGVSISPETRSRRYLQLIGLIYRKINATSQAVLALESEEQNARLLALMHALSKKVENPNFDQQTRQYMTLHLTQIVRHFLDAVLAQIQQHREFQITPNSIRSILNSRAIALALSGEEKIRYEAAFHEQYIFQIKISDAVTMQTPLSNTSISANLSDQQIDLFDAQTPLNPISVAFAYESGQFTTSHTQGNLDLPLEFQSTIQVELDACSQEPHVRVVISRLGAERERFRLGSMTRELPGMLRAWSRAALSDLRRIDGSYEILTPLRTEAGQVAQYRRTAQTVGENGRIAATLTMELARMRDH